METASLLCCVQSVRQCRSQWGKKMNIWTQRSFFFFFFCNTISRALILLALKDRFIPLGVRNKSPHSAFIHKTRCRHTYNHQHAVNFHFHPLLKAKASLLNPSSAPQVHHLQPIKPRHNPNRSAAAFSGHASSASFLSQYWYMRS